MVSRTEKLPTAAPLAPRRSNAEVWLGLSAALIIGIAYIAFELVSEPSPGAPIEHLMGIGGTLLMLFTEIAYSARKRLGWLKVGKVSGWLSLHIFTGIVGPAMVIFHTTFKYNGALATVATALTGLVVLSGFLGRYLYTAIPRTVSGVEMSKQELAERIAEAHARLNAATAGDARPSRQQRVAKRKVAALRRQVKQAERQLAMLDRARKLLGLWHLIHIPMGLTLFGAAAIHVFAVYYYGAAVIP